MATEIVGANLILGNATIAAEEWWMVTTWTSPSPGWSARGEAGSVCPDGRTANTLVFAVLTVKSIEEQVESNILTFFPDCFWNQQEALCHWHMPCF